MALAKVRSREPVTVMSSHDEPEVVTPELLHWLYKTFTYVPPATGQNTLGIAGYLNVCPSPTDLTTFITIFRTDAVALTFSVEQVDSGGYDPGHPGDEGNLNTQTHGHCVPDPHIYYSTGVWLH